MRFPRALAPVLLLAVAACGPRPDPQAAEKERLRLAAADAAKMAEDVQAALDAGNWTLARAQCDVLAFRHRDSAEVARLAKPCADARAHADELAETARLQGLWSYQTQPVGKGRQFNASIYAKDVIDTGAGRSRPRLIFRDHPSWGRSSYLVIDNGDFDCYGGCTLKVEVDGKPRTMAGDRPRTDEAIAMFVKDERSLWRAVKKARTLTITLPLKGATPRQAVFEVGGLDPSQMPGW